MFRKSIKRNLALALAFVMIFGLLPFAGIIPEAFSNRIAPKVTAEGLDSGDFVEERENADIPETELIEIVPEEEAEAAVPDFEEAVIPAEQAAGYEPKSPEQLREPGDPGEPITDPEASITRNGNEIPYATLTEAITAAAPGETVKLEKDIASQSVMTVYTISKSITIDLNGHEIKAENLLGDNFALFDISADVVIKDGSEEKNGKITLGSQGAGVYAENGGSVTISDITVTGGTNGVFVASGAAAVIESGTFKDQTYECLFSDGELIVNGGSFTNTSNNSSSYVINSSGTLTFNDGTVISAKGRGMRANSGTATINGGTFNAFNHALNVAANALVTVEGGTFYTTNTAKNAGFTVYSSGAPLTINGGTIDAAAHGIYVAGGRVILNGGTVSGDYMGIRASANGAVFVNNGNVSSASLALFSQNTVVINNGKISGVGSAATGVQIQGQGASLYMTGGTVESDNLGLYVLNNGAATLMGGHVKSHSIHKNYALWIKGGEVSARGNAVIESIDTDDTDSNEDNILTVYVLADISFSHDHPTSSVFTLSGNAKVLATGAGSSGIFVVGKGAELYVNGGTILSTGLFAISGNGTIYKVGDGSEKENNSETVIEINGGTITAPSTVAAFYHPQYGTLKISGGTMTGGTSLYFRCGILTMTGGTLRGTGDWHQYTFYSGGCVSTGDGLLVDHFMYPGDEINMTEMITAYISGGTILSDHGAQIAGYFNNSNNSHYYYHDYLFTDLGNVYITEDYFNNTVPVVDYPTPSDPDTANTVWNEMWIPNPDATGTGAKAPDADPLTDPSNYAYKLVLAVNLVFHKNDGSDEIKLTRVPRAKYGVEWHLEENTFKREGWCFTEWNTVPNPTSDEPGKVYADKALTDFVDGADHIEPEIVELYYGTEHLYAQWAPMGDLIVKVELDAPAPCDRTFVYTVNAASSDAVFTEITVFLTVPKNQTTASVTIKDVIPGPYNVTQLNDWSWDYSHQGGHTVTVTVVGAEEPPTAVLPNPEVQRPLCWLYGEKRTTNTAR